jgi:hypothetical protein
VVQLQEHCIPGTAALVMATPRKPETLKKPALFAWFRRSAIRVIERHGI